MVKVVKKKRIEKKLDMEEKKIIRKNMLGQSYDCTVLLQELNKLSSMLAGSYMDARPDDFWLIDMIRAVENRIRYDKPSCYNTFLPSCYIYSAIDYQTTVLDVEEIRDYLLSQKKSIESNLKYLYEYKPYLKQNIPEKLQKKHWWK